MFSILFNEWAFPVIRNSSCIFLVVHMLSKNQLYHINFRFTCTKLEQYKFFVCHYRNEQKLQLQFLISDWKVYRQCLIF